MLADSCFWWHYRTTAAWLIGWRIMCGALSCGSFVVRCQGATAPCPGTASHSLLACLVSLVTINTWWVRLTPLWCTLAQVWLLKKPPCGVTDRAGHEGLQLEAKHGVSANQTLTVMWPPMGLTSCWWWRAAGAQLVEEEEIPVIELTYIIQVSSSATPWRDGFSDPYQTPQWLNSTPSPRTFS